MLHVYSFLLCLHQLNCRSEICALQLATTRPNDTKSTPRYPSHLVMLPDCGILLLVTRVHQPDRTRSEHGSRLASWSHRKRGAGCCRAPQGRWACKSGVEETTCVFLPGKGCSTGALDWKACVHARDDCGIRPTPPFPSRSPLDTPLACTAHAQTGVLGTLLYMATKGLQVSLGELSAVLQLEMMLQKWQAPWLHTALLRKV